MSHPLCLLICENRFEIFCLVRNNLFQRDNFLMAKISKALLSVLYGSNLATTVFDSYNTTSCNDNDNVSIVKDRETSKGTIREIIPVHYRSR